jgi:hypothetical protein
MFILFKRKKSRFFWLLLLLAGVTVWYLQLDERQKRFVQNIVRQIPYLPARYSV